MFVILLFFCGVSGASQSALHSACGYDSCPEINDDFVHIHIVPVSPSGVGGLRNFNDDALVNMLDNVIDRLWTNEKMRFTIVEVGVFLRWWEVKSEDIQSKVRKMVQSGRLQFAGGGWNLNDEATTHYQSIIDQFTWGLSMLSQTFGACGTPHVGWQYDASGHSREFASLLAAMGYDGLFVGRIDYQDKWFRQQTGSLEMLWRGDDVLGGQSDIFTSVLYLPPDMDQRINSLRTNQQLFNQTVPGLAKEMVNTARDLLSTGYETTNIMLTFETEFDRIDTDSWFSNLEKIIEYANVTYGQNIRLFYSTPDCYLKAVRDARPTLAIKQDDFFPYSKSGDYWTGYYSTRTSFRYFERVGNSYLQMAKQLQLLADLEDDKLTALRKLKSAMGVMQHEHSITGRTYHAEDMLDEAIEDALVVVRQAFGKLMGFNMSQPPLLSFERCPLNESSCETSELSKQFVVTVYNHLAWHVKEVIRIPVIEGQYDVYAPSGKKIVSQLVDIPMAVLELPTRDTDATHEIVFIAYLQPVSFKSFYVKKTTRKVKRDTDDWIEEPKVEEVYQILENKEQLGKKVNINLDADQKLTDYDDDKDAGWKSIISSTSMRTTTTNNHTVEAPTTTEKLEKIEIITRGPVNAVQYPGFREETEYLGNQHLKLRVHRGSITSMILPGGMDLKFDINFCYYPSTDSQSTIHILKPYSNKPYERIYNLTKGPSGDVVKELRIFSANNVEAYVRLYDDLQFVEIDWVVGPADMDDGIGKEFIVRYTTDIGNNGEFYTDSNGRQVIKRKLNQRPQWGVEVTQPVAGNYYPVTNKIYIEDYLKRVAVLTDRAEGGTSLNEGQIELMLYRGLLRFFTNYETAGELERLLGVQQYVRGRHRIVASVTDKKEDYFNEKKEVIQFHLQPQVFISNVDFTLEQWVANMTNNVSFVHELPEGIHLLTLEYWFDNTMLLRLENYLDTSDKLDPTIDVDLTKIFKTITLMSFRETTLAANKWFDENVQWTWLTRRKFSESFNEEYGNRNEVGRAKYIRNLSDKGFIIKLRGKQIRTFIVQYQFNNE